jgi:WD40 repeat protein
MRSILFSRCALLRRQREMLTHSSAPRLERTPVCAPVTCWVFVSVALATAAAAQVSPKLNTTLAPKIDGATLIDESVPDVVWQRELSSWTYALAFSADGTRLVAHHGDNVTLYEAADARLLREIHARPPRGTRAVALSASDTLAVTAGTYIDLYDLDSGVPMQRIGCSGCNRVIRGLSFSPDGRWLAVQDAAGPTERSRGIGAVRIIDVHTQQTVVELPGVGIGSIPTVSFSADGRKLLASHATGKLVGFRVWDTSDWHVLSTEAFPDMGALATGSLRTSDFVAVHGNGETLEMHDLTNDVLLWSVPLIRPDFDLLGGRYLRGPPTLRQAALAADGSWLLTYEGQYADGGSVEGAIVVRRTRDGAVLAVYDLPNVTSLAIAPDSKTFSFTFRLDQTTHRMALIQHAPSSQ